MGREDVTGYVADLDVVVTGRVKWFDGGKGFGFIIADDGGPDILLHANVLRNFGLGSVAEDVMITVRTQVTPRGVQAFEVLSIDTPEPSETTSHGSLHPDIVADPDAPFVASRVKWYDKAKGFGFANVFGLPEDVFIHAEILRRFGLADLQAGEAVAIKVVEGPRGKMAAEVRPWDIV